MQAIPAAKAQLGTPNKCCVSSASHVLAMGCEKKQWVLSPPPVAVNKAQCCSIHALRSCFCTSCGTEDLRARPSPSRFATNCWQMLCCLTSLAGMLLLLPLILIITQDHNLNRLLLLLWLLPLVLLLWPLSCLLLACNDTRQSMHTMLCGSLASHHMTATCIGRLPETAQNSIKPSQHKKLYPYLTCSCCAVAACVGNVSQWHRRGLWLAAEGKCTAHTVTRLYCNISHSVQALPCTWSAPVPLMPVCPVSHNRMQVFSCSTHVQGMTVL